MRTARGHTFGGLPERLVDDAHGVSPAKARRVCRLKYHAHSKWQVRMHMRKRSVDLCIGDGANVGCRAIGSQR